MGTTSETKPKRYISVGLLAHVDSGKTTLSEGILYLTGQIRKPGRVDHGDAFLDNYALERQRGITIFSKQAVFQLGDSQDVYKRQDKDCAAIVRYRGEDIHE